MRMRRKGKNLEFISFIKIDGTGTIMIPSEWNEYKDFPKVDDMSYVDDTYFRLTPLSISKSTFIASGFNSFVVKLRK